jgi:pimeloyl-ACP methyl ester carboxylesterase
LQDIVLIGHSFGGGIALHLAAKCRKISRLVLIDSAGIAPTYPSWKLPFWLISKTFRNLFFYKDTSMSRVIVRDFFVNIGNHLFSL